MQKINNNYQVMNHNSLNEKMTFNITHFSVQKLRHED